MQQLFPTFDITVAILNAKEALEKPIEERDDRDINLIDNLCSRVRGFAIFPKTVRRALAEHAVLAVIDQTGKELIIHNEILDSYCVLIYGVCEQLDPTKTKTIRRYDIGDAFGVCELTNEVVRFNGYMRTLWDNCAFLCVKRDDYFAILTDPANFPTKEIERHRDHKGNVVCISQLDITKKSNSTSWPYNLQTDSPLALNLPDGHTISKATEDCLMNALVNGYEKVDPNYIDDFLILFRVFSTTDSQDKENNLPPGMTKLCSSLINWLDYEPYRDKIVKIVLIWSGSYYQDFELNHDFSYLFFKELESKLLQLSMNDQLHLLHITLSAKSKSRNVIVSRSSREQPLPFIISGGCDKNCGIFVTHVYQNNPSSSNHINSFNHRSKFINNNTNNRNGIFNDNRLTGSLRPGDQILEMNGINFTAIKLTEAQKKLDMSTHLSLTVKYNPSAFYEMQTLSDGRRKSSSIMPTPGLPSTSPFYTNTQSVFSFNNQDQLLATKSCNDNYPPPSPLFSSNANLGFSSMIKTSSKHEKCNGDSKFKLSNLINSSKQIVKQIRDSAMTATNIDFASNKNQDQLSESSSIGGTDSVTSKSRSIPDLASLRQRSNCNIDQISQDFETNSSSDSNVFKTDESNVNVLRIFNATNNDFRYILVHEDTTAKDAILIALKEFNINPSISTISSYDRSISLDWKLYEVSVVPESKIIKQKCLAEQTTKLADRASICSRYYIKSNTQTCNSGPNKLDSTDDSLVNEILRESPPTVSLTSLNATFLAVELTLTDFDKFKFIEPQQFVYDTFFDYSDKKKKQPVNDFRSHHSSTNIQEADELDNLNKTRVVPKEWMAEYQEFANISNKEMFWVICEILNERNIGRRVKIIKQFIRIADVCLQLRNYNSMFAIISGLGHNCVTRLKRTFEKLKPKYKTQLDKMSSLFDPSRNMHNYRLCLDQTPPPAIPLFPQIKKDLTFTKEGKSIFIRESNESSDDEDDNEYRNRTHENTQPNGIIPAPRTRSLINCNHQSNPQPRSCILINFAEIRQFTSRISKVTYFSSVPYSNDLLSNTKENQRNQAQIKKMYEEWQMRKRIRHYIKETFIASDSLGVDQVDGGFDSKGLDKVLITFDERLLLSKSIEVEPDLSKPQVSEKTTMQSQQISSHIQNTIPTTNTTSSSDSPSLSESSSIQNFTSFAALPTTDFNLNNELKQHVYGGLDRILYDPLSNSNLVQRPATLMYVDQQYQFVRPANSAYFNNRIPVCSNRNGKFGTENVDNIRKLQALSEARHKA